MEKIPTIEGREEQPMNTYKPEPGEKIWETAEKMIVLAKETKGGVKAKFNDIELLATEDSTVSDIVTNFTTKSAKATESYRY